MPSRIPAHQIHERRSSIRRVTLRIGRQLIAGSIEAGSMIYRFGDVQIDTAARQATRDDALAHLTRKAFDLLVLLIEQRPNVVSKEEIHARL